MNATTGPISPGAWMKSLALHGAIVALMLFIAYSAKLDADKQPRIIELVAGPGDDYAATEAPALGDPSSVKLAVPKVEPPPASAPAVSPPQPAQEEPLPIVPAPQPQPVKKEVAKTPPPTPKTTEPTPNFARQIKAKVATAKKKAEAEVAKQRKKEEERRKADERKKAEEQKKDQARMSLAEFNAKYPKKTASASSASTSKSASANVKKIDTKGIRDGIAGGSPASKAGANGKALTRAEAALIELYFSDLLGKLRRAFEEDRPPGLSDSLKVTIEVKSNANGSLTNARVSQPSGNPEFDKAVLEALRRVKMGPRPDQSSETVSFVFTMREE